MKFRICLVLVLTLLLSITGGACLFSDLENSFDLKSPQGLLLYLGGGTSQDACRFDQNVFDACRLGP